MEKPHGSTGSFMGQQNLSDLGIGEHPVVSHPQLCGAVMSYLSSKQHVPSMRLVSRAVTLAVDAYLVDESLETAFDAVLGDPDSEGGAMLGRQFSVEQVWPWILIAASQEEVSLKEDFSDRLLDVLEYEQRGADTFQGLAYSYDSGYQFMEAKPPCVIANVTMALDYRDLIPQFSAMTTVELTLSRREYIGGAFLSQCYTMKHLKLRVVGVVVIGKSFLRNCVALETVDWGDNFRNVEVIGSCFLEGCCSLKSVDFSQISSVQSLDPYGFLGKCTSLLKEEGARRLDLSPLRYALYKSDYHQDQQKIPWIGENVAFRAAPKRHWPGNPWEEMLKSGRHLDQYQSFDGAVQFLITAMKLLNTAELHLVDAQQLLYASDEELVEGQQDWKRGMEHKNHQESTTIINHQKAKAKELITQQLMQQVRSTDWHFTKVMVQPSPDDYEAVALHRQGAKMVMGHLVGGTKWEIVAGRVYDSKGEEITCMSYYTVRGHHQDNSPQAHVVEDSPSPEDSEGEDVEMKCHRDVEEEEDLYCVVCNRRFFAASGLAAHKENKQHRLAVAQAEKSQQQNQNNRKKKDRYEEKKEKVKATADVGGCRDELQPTFTASNSDLSPETMAPPKKHKKNMRK